jgi:hypothetical protein
MSSREESPHHARSWKVWVFEFLLIFLSVSLSFAANSYREHLAGRSRAKTYAANMIADLESDTAYLRSRVEGTRTARDNVDTFLSLIAQRGGRDASTGKLYWYGLWCGYIAEFAPDDATFRAMTSSGDLRLFDYPRVGRYVVRYYAAAALVARQAAADEPIYARTRDLHARIFDFQYNSRANQVVQANRKSFSQARIDAFIRTNPPLLSRDPALMSEYGEMCRSRFFRGQVGSLGRALEAADTAIARLRTVAG